MNIKERANHIYSSLQNMFVIVNVRQQATYPILGMLNDIIGICRQLCDISHLFVPARWEGSAQFNMNTGSTLIFIDLQVNRLQVLDCFIRLGYLDSLWACGYS